MSTPIERRFEASRTPPQRAPEGVRSAPNGPWQDLFGLSPFLTRSTMLTQHAMLLWLAHRDCYEVSSV